MCQTISVYVGPGFVVGFLVGVLLTSWVADRVCRRDPDRYWRGVWTAWWYQRTRLSPLERSCLRIGVVFISLVMVSVLTFAHLCSRTSVFRLGSAADESPPNHVVQPTAGDTSIRASCSIGASLADVD